MGWEGYLNILNFGIPSLINLACLLFTRVISKKRRASAIKYIISYATKGASWLKIEQNLTIFKSSPCVCFRIVSYFWGKDCVLLLWGRSPSTRIEAILSISLRKGASRAQPQSWGLLFRILGRICQWNLWGKRASLSGLPTHCTVPCL